MPKIILDNTEFDVTKGWTILEAAKFYGIEIPTLCHYEGLTDWGGCRICVVEIAQGSKTKLVSACTYIVEDGLEIKSASTRVIKTRMMILELLIAQCPSSKNLQDMASRWGLNKVRFKPKWEKCIYCGLCVRICEEQMTANAIGFVNRGNKLKISTPFDKTSEQCKRCGGCMYICPVCTTRCEGTDADSVLCNGCYNDLQPTCLPEHDNYSCWMGLKNECGTCVIKKPEQVEKGKVIYVSAIEDNHQ